MFDVFISICDIYFFIRFYDNFFFISSAFIYIFSCNQRFRFTFRHFYCDRQTVVHINALSLHMDPFTFFILRVDRIKRLDVTLNLN